MRYLFFKELKYAETVSSDREAAGLPLLGVRSREMGRLPSRESGRSLQRREKLRAGWLSPQTDATGLSSENWG